jgi:WD40 repeat protein
MVRDANSLCFSPDGAHLFLGCPRGALQQVALAALSPEESGRKRKAAVGGAELRAEATGMATEHQGVVDCVAFTADGRMASKSMEGRVHVWDMATRSSVATWRVSARRVWELRDILGSKVCSFTAHIWLEFNSQNLTTPFPFP